MKLQQWVVEGGLWTAIGGVVTYLGTLIWQRRVHKDEQETKRQDREDRITQHSEGLAIELLKLAKSEATALRQQVHELQLQLGGTLVLERQLGYFEEALQHIEALLEAKNGKREGAEHNARIFMARMVALRQIKGNAANEEQVARAAQKLIGNDDAGSA